MAPIGLKHKQGRPRGSSPNGGFRGRNCFHQSTRRAAERFRSPFLSGIAIAAGITWRT
jgi:hypothetical protein